MNPSNRGPKRVLFVINSLARGGAETQMMGVVSRAVGAGNSVRVATLSPGNDFGPQLAELGVDLWCPAAGSRRWSPLHLARLAWRIVAWRPEVTVAFLFQATIFTRVANILARPHRKISSMRNERLETRARARIYRATCWLDDYVVVNSASAAAKLQQTGTIPKSQAVKVIYNGVDDGVIRGRVTRRRHELRQAIGIETTDFVVLGVGRLEAQKNWVCLLDAIALSERTSHCLIAGDGELGSALRARIAALNLRDRVDLLGLRSDVADLMAASDYLVLSSDYEGTPNVLLEALCLGLPAIATDVGACAELLTREGDFIVPPGDPAAFAAALDQAAVRSESGRGASGPAGVAATNATANFSWTQIGDEWLKLMGASIPSSDFLSVASALEKHE